MGSNESISMLFKKSSCIHRKIINNRGAIIKYPTIMSLILPTQIRTINKPNHNVANTPNTNKDNKLTKQQKYIQYLVQKHFDFAFNVVVFTCTTHLNHIISEYM